MIVHRYNSTGHSNNNSNSKTAEDDHNVTTTTTISNRNNNNNNISSGNRHHHGVSPISTSSSLLLSRSISPTATSVISPSSSLSLQSIRRIKNCNSSNHYHHSPRRRMITTKQCYVCGDCCFYATRRINRTKYYCITLLFVVPLLLLISILIIFRVNILQQQQVNNDESSTTTSSSSFPSSLYGKCAINLYGLPRQYENMVHNSIIENIIIPNIQYNCDYYIHYYNTITIETSNELRGVDINHGNSIFNPNEILILQKTIYNLHEIYYNTTIKRIKQKNNYTNNSNSNSNIIPPYERPIVQYSTTSEDDFRIQYQSFIETIHTYQYPILYNQYHRTRNHHNHSQYQYIYQTLSDTSLSFTNNTYINIIKMYHSQQSVFQLMDNQNNNQQNSYYNYNNLTEYMQKPHYTRIGMFRNDVLYVTPINIYHIPKRKQYFSHSITNINKNKRSSRQFTKQQQSTNEQQNDYEYDINNQYAIIPNFGQYPINDRMIIGPYDAIKIYTTYKFRLLYDHVHTLAQLQKQQLQIQQQQSFLNNILPSFLYRKSSNNNYKQHRTSLLHGIHSENLLYYTIFPYIQDAGIQIIIDPNICFLRVRTDYTIRISDCGIQCSKVPKIYTNIQYIESILNRTCIQPIDTSIPNVPFLSCPPLSSSISQRRKQQQSVSKNRKRNRRNNNHRRNNKNYKLIKKKDYTIKSKIKLQQREQEQLQELSNDSIITNNKHEFDKQQQQQKRQLRLRVAAVRQQKQKRKLKWSSCPWE